MWHIFSLIFVCYWLMSIFLISLVHVITNAFMSYNILRYLEKLVHVILIWLADHRPATRIWGILTRKVYQNTKLVGSVSISNLLERTPAIPFARLLFYFIFLRTNILMISAISNKGINTLNISSYVINEITFCIIECSLVWQNVLLFTPKSVQ